MTDIYHAISTIGFPIFVAVYLLIKVERVVDSNTEAIINLKEIIMKMK